MTLLEFIYRIDGFAGFLVNALICGIAGNLYQDTRKHSVLLISIASGIGAFLGLWFEIQRGDSSRTLWCFAMILRIAAAVMWLIGIWRLLRDYKDLLRTPGQSGSVLQSGLPAPADNSTPAEPPPSAN